MTAVSIALVWHLRTLAVVALAGCAVWLVAELAAAATRRRPPLDDMDLTLAKLKRGLRHRGTSTSSGGRGKPWWRARSQRVRAAGSIPATATPPVSSASNLGGESWRS